MSNRPLIIIPARFDSRRLPGKPLKKIGNKTLIEHAIESSGNPREGHDVVVATDSPEICEITEGYVWAESFMTDKNLETGTDRCAQAVEQDIGWEDAPNWIINVQGDMPFGTAGFIDRLIAAIEVFPDADVITPVCDVPCVVWDWQPRFAYPRRTSMLQHVGIYAYKKNALKLFYESRGETHCRKREAEFNLEQLRAVDLHMDIETIIVRDMLPPLEVNTIADLDRINEIAKRTNTGD